MDVERIVRKGMRLTKPTSVNLKLRPTVYKWFADLAASSHCGVGVLFVGILEDFYDQHSSGKEDPDHG